MGSDSRGRPGRIPAWGQMGRGIQRPEWSLPGVLVRVGATEQAACLTCVASVLSPT